MPRRHLAHRPLHGIEHPVERRHQCLVGRGVGPGRQPQEVAQLVDVPERQAALSEDGDRDDIEAEGLPLGPRLRIGVDVAMVVRDLVVRKELLRRGARGSPRAGIQPQYLFGHAVLLV